MLYSRSMDIGFAHYPKTAGHSLTRWFREVFPDAAMVELHPVYEVNHLPVRYSLEKLGLVPQGDDRPLARRHRLTRACVALAGRLGRWLPAGLAASHDATVVAGKPCPTRVIGVVREPFEMLVSLFEYWRSYDFEEEPPQPLIQCARRDAFRQFLVMAVAERTLLNYHDFFDMGGPASSNTRLLDFNSLEPALRQVCREFGVNVSVARLGLLNVGPSPRRDLQAYRTQAGSLMSEVRAHFRWYYEEGIHVMVTGNGATAPARTIRSARWNPLSGIGRKAPGEQGARGPRWTGATLAGSGS